MSLIEALVLAVLQGLTEFLPVSSSGHLVMAAELTQLPLRGSEREAFFVLLHAASLLAVLVYFGREIVRLLSSADRGRALVAIGIGCVPAGLVALALKASGSTALFETPWVVGVAWIATAALLFVTRRVGRGSWGPFERGFGRGVGFLLLVGLAQAVAIVPGISRSGATIAVALLAGMHREEAFRYSFFMALPLIAAAQVIELEALGPVVDAASGGVLAIAFGACFLVSVASLWVLAKMVRGGRLAWFAPYCLVAGLVTLVLWGTGTLS
ncbi:MAG: undecaprenyl-diphosphate phosphatase [Planctomycetota bacterium]|nr:undecaprenyl-diphosphate phosphatase [Planctomycetota bacterium]